ncbi:guanosine-3',5'-bis(diphosphate) 3'-pyrophosphohydrolase [Actinobacillus equuli]|nr:guanosine-3',5'-bis(diphosphate) 3'-pyrophosphohydrolase [Actinobacillus equuli]
MASLTNAIASMNSNIGTVESRPNGTGNYQVKMRISVTDNAHLYVVIQKLTKVNGVIRVTKA